MSTRTIALSFAIVGCATAIAVARGAQAPTFSAKVVSVRVDALVVDRDGHAIPNLKDADFELLDNGVPQKIDFVSSGKVPVNLVLALDTSESMAGDRLARLREAASAVLAGLRQDDQAALLTFSHIIQLHSELTTDVARVSQRLRAAEGGTGETALMDAVYSALLVGQSSVGRTLLIVFSDGIDTSSWLTPDGVLQAARRSNATVYTATTGAASRLTFVNDVTRVTGGRSFPVASVDEVQRAFLSILDEFRQRYLIGYTPQDVTKEGWHTLQVRVKNRRATVTAREGYTAGS